MLFDGSHFISGTASRIISKLVLLPAIALLGAGNGAVTTYNYVINNYDHNKDYSTQLLSNNSLSNSSSISTNNIINYKEKSNIKPEEKKNYTKIKTCIIM